MSNKRAHGTHFIELISDADPETITDEQAAEIEREWLSDRHCYLCGQSDTEELTIELPVTPDCPIHDIPEPEPRAVCEQGHGHTRTRWRKRLREDAKDEGAAAVVVYECDVPHFVEKPEVSVDENGTPHPEEDQPQPEAPIKCRCGATVSKIIYDTGINETEDVDGGAIETEQDNT
jgi:hypothetical protein